MAHKILYNTLFVALLIVCLSPCAPCRPATEDQSEEKKLKMLVDPSEYPGSLSHETILKLQQCESNAETMELCMRCAKVTKSEIIYPMCCNNDDEVKDWCHSYVYYGQDDGY